MFNLNNIFNMLVKSIDENSKVHKKIYYYKNITIYN